MYAQITLSDLPSGIPWTCATFRERLIYKIPRFGHASNYVMETKKILLLLLTYAGNPVLTCPHRIAFLVWIAFLVRLCQLGLASSGRSAVPHWAPGVNRGHSFMTSTRRRERVRLRYASGRGEEGSSPMWTSTRKIKIRVYWRHHVFFSSKEVGVFF